MDEIIVSNKLEVSVIIPVYNVEKFLCACVDSVLTQSFQNFEMILVDDGATDQCPAICDAYASKHENIRVIHQRNGGLSAARNTGLAAARGTYVYFLDSDDWLVPSALETLYQIAQRQQADAVFFEASVVDEDGRPYDHPIYTDFYARSVVYSDCMPGRQLFQKLLQNGDYLPAAPLIFMRREKVRHQFEPILHEDELFTPKLLYSIERACTCGEALYVRRVRAGSITTERKTARHFIGLATAARELLLFPEADKSLRGHAITLARYTLQIYHQLEHKDRKAVRAEKRILVDTLTHMRSLNAVATAVALRVPCVFWLIKAIKDAVPNWVYRLNTVLRDRRRFAPALRELANSPLEQGRIFLIGSPEHGNLGDHAIVKAERKFFADHAPSSNLIVIPMPFYRAFRAKLGKLSRESDVIVVSGGGWLGNVWYHNEKIVFDIIKRFHRNRIVIFPQTIYYRASRKTTRQKARAKRIYHTHNNLTMLLREQDSLELARTLCSDARFSPDMCLYLDERAPREREGVLLCFRQDREKTLNDTTIQTIEDTLSEKGMFFRYTTTVLGKSISSEKSEAALEKKLEEFRKARLVITDRLHAALFCAVTGTPCIAFDNLTKKVSGVLQASGMRSNVYFAQDKKEALGIMEKMLLGMNDNEFQAPSFETLIELWRNEIGQN